MRVLEDVTTMVEYCADYGMGHITMEQKFHLFIASAFAKELRKLWQALYRAALASLTGIGQGSKIYGCSSTSSPLTALRLTSARFFRWRTSFHTTCRDSRPRGVITEWATSPWRQLVVVE